MPENFMSSVSAHQPVLSRRHLQLLALLTLHGRLERFPVWLNRDSQGRRNRRVLGKRFGICESFHGQTLFVGLARAGGRGS